MAAFGKLVDRFKTSICAAVQPVLRDWHLVEDVAQETFVAAWERMADLRDASSFRRWLHTIAHNLAVSRVRALAARPARSLVGVEERRILGFPARPGCEITSGGPSATTLARVRKVVLALPNGYGAILVMRHVDGLTVEEIAEVVGQRPASVKAILYRARILARQELLRAGLDPGRVLDAL
jgi:RNA polymerase sigma-70 factor (ECF subfamily)